MRQNNIKIAITGGIGSGKSTVCKFIEEAGYPVYSCDAIYYDLFNCGIFTDKIISEFGNSVSDGKGGVDRKKLSAEVFESKEKLQKLNLITHPIIFSEMFKRSESNAGLVFFEVPVLFEGGYQNLFDEIVVVIRDEKSRMEGIVLRDELSESEALRRIKSQFNYSNGCFAGYYVIHNDGDFNTLRDIIKEILLKITQKIFTLNIL